ncbi:MAG: prolipoprotein diacylglyceryl transferase [Nitrospinota bacterium]|nr:prolipoprotein diacylglyceryl transferase [Nitrospinota bacterium]
MYPELFSIGPVTLHTYGLLVATGFLTGIWWMGRLGAREGIDPDAIYDISFWAVLAAIVGSRLFFVIVNYQQFAPRPLDIFKIWSGGLVFYGGLIGAFIAMVIMAGRRNIPIWKLADIAAQGGALGHSIGRLGCFFAGCCYGLPSSAPWAVTFNNVKSIAPRGVALHPTQLYDSLNELTIFLILSWLAPRKRFAGQVWWTWVGLYAIGRSVVEMYRDDPRGSIFGGALTTSQGVAAAVICVAIFMYAWNWPRKTSQS